MTNEQKIVQYLAEARASELALVRVLQSQLTMTPDGPYRDALEDHLAETRSHAQRISVRLRELGWAENPLLGVLGVAEVAAGQVIALAKTPLDLLRGTSVAEKVLKNAKDTCATEALEIATYTALHHLAETSGDARTSSLAADIRADELHMLDRVRTLLPGLTDEVAADDRSLAAA
jgi:ferritin-like metal-binding protein YciE